MSDFNNETGNFNSSPGSGDFSTNSSNYESPQLEKPSKKPKVLFIVLAVVVVLLGGSITAFACVPPISNRVYLTALSPKNYYLKVEKNAIEDMTNSIASSYGKQIAQLKKMTENPKAASMNMKFSLNDEYVSMLGLSKVLPLELKTTSSVDLKNKKEKIFGELFLANDSLGSINMLTDLSKEKFGSYYLQIPDMSEEYLGYDSSKLIMESEKMQTFYSNYYNEPTSEKLLKTLLSRYSNIIIKNINTVTLDKNTEVSANGATAKNTKIVVTITSKDWKTIIKEIVNTAKNDNDLKNELIRLEVCTEEEYNTLMENAITSSEEIDDSGEDQLLMTVWVDSAGKITGREFTTKAPDKKSTTLAYHTVKEKNTTNFEFSQVADGITNLTVKGKNINEKGLSNGNITAELGSGGSTNYSAAISYDNVTQTNKELGYFSGNFNLSITQIPSVSLKLTATGTDKEQKLFFEAFALETNIGSVEITTAETAFEDFTFPDSEKVYHLDDSEAMKNYMSNANQDYIAKIQNKIKEISENISELFGGLGLTNGSDGPTSIFPINSFSDDDSDTDSNKTDEDIDTPADDEDISTEENNSANQTGDGFTINKNPKTENDLPANAEVDEDGYYSYKLTDKQVMANGEASNTAHYYSSLTFTNIKNNLYEMITKTTNSKWEESRTDSYNSVNGILDNKDSIYTLFTTTTEWITTSDSDYKSFSVKYDTYSKEISEFAISGDSQKDVYAIVKNLLDLTEENFSDKDFEKVKKKLDNAKKDDSVSFDFGNSSIYYSISKDGSCYCSLEAKEQQ